jgi:subfamily B ATP-binding cassette protein HlyB/CyaB
MTEQVDDIETLLPPLPRSIPFRFSRPCVLQYEEMECGAACLATVSAHYGNELSVGFWRERLKVNQEGTSLYDIVSAAERSGFAAHGLEISDIDALPDHLFPVIVLRDQHYVVVYEADEERVLAADPAVGLQKLSLEEFNQGFDGHVVMLRPTERFYETRLPPRRYKHLAAMFQGHGPELGLILGCSLALTALSVVPAFLSQFIMDEVLPKKDPGMLAVGIGAAFTVSVVMNAVNWLRSYYLAFLASRFDLSSASKFMRALFALPYGFFTMRHVGDFNLRLSEMSRLREFVTGDLMGTLLDSMNLLIYGVLLWLYSPPVALLVFLSAPCLVGVSALFTKRLTSLINRTFNASADKESLLADQIKGIATIKTLGAEKASRWRFEAAMVRTLGAYYDFQLAGAALSSLSALVNNLIGYSIMALAALMAVRGEMTPGQILSVSILAGGVIGPFHTLAAAWGTVQQVGVVTDRLNDVLLAEPEAASVAASSAAPPERLRGEIEFQDVWFRYGGESSEWVLKGVSFAVRPGQSAAIVGASGSGKSTVALLAARLYEPTNGRILIDGRDSREYDQKWLRRQIGLVLQETSLFQGTLLENIALAADAPDPALADRAAEAADAKAFILQKGRDYSYRITHGGRGLSGGQKQRIAIARILYADPPILFLDEATSSLDTRSERAILKSLRKERPDRTIVSIAHRQATVLMSDFAVVMDAGRVVEVGTHGELLRSRGGYAALFGQLAGDKA